MTLRQRIMKFFYPALLLLNRVTSGKGSVVRNTRQSRPHHSVYDLETTDIHGQPLPLGAFRGRKMLFVNTASNCGYTQQYDDLEQLYRQFPQRLVIIGFPSNNFHNQEKGSNSEIAEFCRINFGVSFPLAEKSDVLPGKNQNRIFRWLTRSAENGWNNKVPEWNFSKYLLNEEGVLTHYFGPSVSPRSEMFRKAILE